MTRQAISRSTALGGRQFVLRGTAIGIVVMVGLGYAVVHLGAPAFSIDGRVYAEAARTWLEGGDPWATEVQGLSLAAPPTVLLVATPLALLPSALIGLVSVAIAATCAVIAVRLARVGWWWLLTIPVVEGVMVGSLDLLAVALMIWALRSEGGRARLVGVAVAVLAKPYALLPAIALGRRSVVLAGALAVIVTAPFLPWPRYIAEFSALSRLLVQQAGNGIGSPWATPILLPPTIVALVILGRRDGSWLLVPALWPATQVHYSVFMIPVGSPVLALVSLAPVPAPAAVAVMALAIVRWTQGQLDPWSWVPDRWTPAGRSVAGV